MKETVIGTIIIYLTTMFSMFLFGISIVNAFNNPTTETLELLGFSTVLLIISIIGVITMFLIRRDK